MKVLVYATLAILASTPVFGADSVPWSARGRARGTELPRLKDGAAGLRRWS